MIIYYESISVKEIAREPSIRVYTGDVHFSIKEAL